MDMDDDFIGEIEFNLSPEQAELVSRAINVASSSRGDDDFAQINPLIAIMSWWKATFAGKPGPNFAGGDTG